MFGIPLMVETIAFQEQDQVVAACATSALWSVFQLTGQLFHHPILSPVQITKAATAGVPYRSRAIPNEGLDPEQMASAIRDVRLEPNLLEINNVEVLFSTLYAYIRGHVPVIAGVRLSQYVRIVAGHPHVRAQLPLWGRSTYSPSTSFVRAIFDWYEAHH